MMVQVKIAAYQNAKVLQVLEVRILREVLQILEEDASLGLRAAFQILEVEASLGLRAAVRNLEEEEPSLDLT